MKKTNNSRFGSPSEWENELGGSKLYKHTIRFQEFVESEYDAYFEILSQQQEAFTDFNDAVRNRLQTTLLVLNDDGVYKYFIHAYIYKDGESGYSFVGFGMNEDGSVYNEDTPFGFGFPLRDVSIVDEVEEL